MSPPDELKPLERHKVLAVTANLEALGRQASVTPVKIAMLVCLAALAFALTGMDALILHGALEAATPLEASITGEAQQTLPMLYLWCLLGASFAGGHVLLGQHPALRKPLYAILLPVAIAFLVSLGLIAAAVYGPMFITALKQQADSGGPIILDEAMKAPPPDWFASLLASVGGVALTIVLWAVPLMSFVVISALIDGCKWAYRGAREGARAFVELRRKAPLFRRVMRENPALMANAKSEIAGWPTRDSTAAFIAAEAGSDVAAIEKFLLDQKSQLPLAGQSLLPGPHLDLDLIETNLTGLKSSLARPALLEALSDDQSQS